MARGGGKVVGGRPARQGGSKQPGVPNVKMGPLKGNKGPKSGN
jgi:hypothetical protein